MSTDHRAGARLPVPGRALWFGLLGAPAAWSLHVLGATALNSTACIAPLPSRAPTGLRLGSAPGVVLLGMTGLALLIAVLALLTALISWEKARSRPGELGETGELLEIGEGRTSFMALSGVLLGALFTCVLIANAVAIVAIPQCQP